MKKYLVFVLLFAAQAFACPDLSGTYMCMNGDNEVEQVVTQSVKRGVTTYTFATEDVVEEIVADGKKHVDGKASQIAKCDSNKSLKLIQKANDRGFELDVEMLFSADSVGIHTKGHVIIRMGGNPMGVEKIEETCRRI